MNKMIKNGDRLRVIKPLGKVIAEKDVGKICTVTSYIENNIYFKFENGTYGWIADHLMTTYFEILKPFEEEEKHEEKQQEEVFSLVPDNIDEIMDNCELEVSTVFGKCTIVACKLPNGFVLVESSACVDPTNYDEHIGLEICLNRIRDKVWELEGYKLQQKIHDTINAKHNLSLVQPCTCNEDCDLCKPEQKFCPYHCNGNCNTCSRIKGD